MSLAPLDKPVESTEGTTMIKINDGHKRHSPLNPDGSIHGAAYTRENGTNGIIVQIDPGSRVHGRILNEGSWVNVPGGECWNHDMVDLHGFDNKGNSVTVRFPLNMIPLVELSEDTAERLLLQVRRERIGSVLDRYSGG